MSRKMIVMSFSLIGGFNHEMKRNFEHLIKKHNHERVVEWF
jgi:hypothetical protein